MEDHFNAPIDITIGAPNGPAPALPSPSGGRTAGERPEAQDGACSKVVACTVLGCIASFGMGLAVASDGWNVPRSAVAGGLLVSALAGGLAGAYVRRWRKRPAPADVHPPAIEPVFQVSHEDVIGDILQPLNELNRGLRRDMTSRKRDHSMTH
jgi:hypothetical protein